METLFEYCKNLIFDQLDANKGREVYACDLSGELTEGIYCDGTFTYSIAKAKEYLLEWWYDAEQFSEYEKLNFGERSNPFENVELFTVKMVCEGCATILAQCGYVDKRWQGKITLSPQAIRTIKSQIEEMDEDMDLF